MSWGARGGSWGGAVADVADRARHVVDLVGEFGTSWAGAAGQDVRIEVGGAGVANVGPSSRPSVTPAPGLDWRVIALAGVVLLVASS